MEDTGWRFICCDNNLVLQIREQKNERGVLWWGYSSSRTITDKPVMSIKMAAQSCSITPPLPPAWEEEDCPCSCYIPGLWSLSPPSNLNLDTLLKRTDINCKGNKKTYSAPFRSAVMSPCWPFNWKNLDGVLRATVMHHCLMTCQGKAWYFFCWCTFFIATSADYERANELYGSVKGDKKNTLLLLFQLFWLLLF